jgi:predicted deacylase
MIKEHIQSLDLEKFERGKLHKVWMDIISDPFGEPMAIPLLIGRGSKEGPVMGITAAVHGNELNGIPVIQRFFKEIENEKISGTVIGVPVVNVPAFMRKKRRFIDNVDLNHIMPGKKSGSVSQVYAHYFFKNIIKHFDYLLDLHTASTGRVNSYYIRADMDDPVTSKLALLQNAQIIVNNPPSDGTLRGAAEAQGIPAITLEVGNPSTFQKGYIRSGITGLHNALVYLEMMDGEIEEPEKEPVLCKSSKWYYTDKGGLLSVHPDLTQMVAKGDTIATQYDIFGDKIKTYKSKSDGVVIGKSISPVNQTGGRILHLGILK